MAVLHDYKCPDHGFFEAMKPVCPQGCKKGVKMVFLKAPSIRSPRTTKADKTLKQLADDFEMTNMRSAKEGESQAGMFKHKKKKQVEQRQPRPGDAAIWGGEFKGVNMNSLMSGRAIRSVAGEAVGVSLQDQRLTGPKTASYFKDQDNLTITK